MAEKLGKTDCILEECREDATVEVRSTILGTVNWWPYCEKHGKKHAKKFNRETRAIKISTDLAGQTDSGDNE